MIAGLAEIAMACVGCSGLGDVSPIVIQVNTGPALNDAAPHEARAGDVPYTPADIAGTQFRLPLKVGNAFSPTNWAQPETAARFQALDLSTPMAVRREQGDGWRAEMAFSAAGEQTGLGFDVEVAPRAQIQHGRAGMDVANFGGELRLGQGLARRDQRHTDAKQPAWYFFIGQDNEALVWNFADKQSLNGLALRDQVTVGDFQAGMAWRTGFGSQTSFGLVQRKLSYNDITGDHDVSLHQDFAAFSFTLKR
jgi:hypothetical protein